jgi:hypothetical protein
MPVPSKGRFKSKGNAPRKDRGPFSFLPIASLGVLVIGGVAVYTFAYSDAFSVKYDNSASSSFSLFAGNNNDSLTKATVYAPLDTALYDRKMLELAHVEPVTSAVVASGTSTATTTPIRAISPWPVKGLPYPKPGAILPFNRIVAYYGNFYSTGMGVLGEYDEATVISKLNAAVAEWTAADPNTPVMPAIEYIDVTAQASAGADGKYRLRMPDTQIDQALEMAKKVNGVVILDVQVGLSDLHTELPLLEKYLKMPEVHLALDPEFSMKTGMRPGTVIGTFDASDINYVALYLANLVDANNLPPKVLIVHRFTEAMVTRYKAINPLPEVQIVMNMDGWGSPQKKIGTYTAFISPEPVQFTGLKLFYKNDLKETPSRLLTTQEILNLTPAPSYIQYQ